MVSGGFGEVGWEGSALDGLREEESLSGLKAWILLRFVEGKRVGFEVLREENQQV